MARVSRGNLLGQVVADDDLAGVVASQGNLGALVGGKRLGGIVANDGIRGQIVVLGSSLGDILVHGSLQGGRIAVKGNVAGNLTIDGTVDRDAAVVTGGSIGDANSGTALSVDRVKGILAAEGAIAFAEPANIKTAAFYGTGLKGTPDAAAIDAIFTDMGQALTFDQSGLDLKGLDLILSDLARLHFADGRLTGTAP